MDLWLSKVVIPLAQIFALDTVDGSENGGNQLICPQNPDPSRSNRIEGSNPFRRIEMNW